MKCPGCAQELSQVKASAAMGRAIVLDQCPSCGGIWFDQWELYQTNDSEVEKLDPVDAKALRQPVPLSETAPQCPKCNSALFRFKDPLLPSDAQILRCPLCQGLWLNRGEFRRFKKLRRERLKSLPKPLPPEAVAIMQKNMGNKEFWQGLEQKTSFLSSQAMSSNMVFGEKTEDIAFSALNILFSLLL